MILSMGLIRGRRLTAQVTESDSRKDIMPTSKMAEEGIKRCTYLLLLSLFSVVISTKVLVFTLFPIPYSLVTFVTITAP